MFTNTTYATGSRELTGRDNQSLIVCDLDCRFMLLSIQKSRGHVIGFLPVEGVTIKLVTPDTETQLDDGSGVTDEIEITGQTIVTLINNGKWYVAGSTPKTRPVGRPVGRPRAKTTTTNTTQFSKQETQTA